MNDLSRTMPAAGPFQPPLPDGHVARGALCERMKAGLVGRLLLITAPAGFGKSTLALEFSRQLPSDWRSAWVGLGGRDQHPARALGQICRALEALLPELDRNLRGALRLRQEHQPFDYEAWVDQLLDALDPDPARPILLILDDYHLASSPALDAALEHLLNHLEPGLTLLVTSRQKPTWHLARLRLARQVMALEEPDLRLAPEQARALLAALGPRLERDQATALIERCEGWVAGLRLWMLATHEQAAPADGAQGLIGDYLVEEVLAGLPPDTQQFLEQTACLERFCVELCDAVRASSDSARHLDYLRAHQIFLQPLDERGRWFRYHALFSDLLRSRLGNLAVHIHRRASHWYQASGRLEHAVEQALRADDAELAARWVQRYSERPLLAEQDVSQLLRWKAGLPDSLLHGHPQLILLYGWALALACQLQAAGELLARLDRHLPAPSQGRQQALLEQWLALSGFIARGRGEREQASSRMQAALACMPERRFGQRQLCLSALGNLALGQSDLHQARQLNRQALELARRNRHPLFEALAHLDRARLLNARGEIHRAIDQTDLGLASLDEQDAQRPYAVRARLRVYQGYLRLQRLESDAGRALLHEGLIEAVQCRDLGVLTAQAALAAEYGRLGDFNAAYAALAQAEQWMQAWDIPPVYYLAMLTATKCDLWLAQGRLDLAGTWLPRLAATYCHAEGACAPEFQPQLAGTIELAMARLEDAQNQPDAAQRLARLLERSRSTGCQQLALRAACRGLDLAWRGDAAADQQWQSAVQGASGGALLPFAELVERHPTRLRQHLEQAPADLAQALRGLLPATTDLLSGRELAVLGLIAQGLSNQQISDRLFISLPTVKTHASHINAKLGVERRTQAVAKAQALGLLQS